MRIFLAHASTDNHVADGIAVGLRQEGHGVFFDDDDLPGGTSYDERIRAAIAASDLIVFLVSPDSVKDGRYTRTELKFAREKWPDPTGRVLPVMVAPTPSADIPPWLQRVSILTPEGDTVAEVAHAVAGYASSAGRRRTAVLAAAAVVLAGAIAAAAWAFWPVAPVPEPDPAQPAPVASYAMACIGGGGMTLAENGDGSVIVNFAKAGQGASLAPIGAGECSWMDRAIYPNEPASLFVPAGVEGAAFLLTQARAGRPFRVDAYNGNRGSFTVVRAAAQ